MKSYNVYKNDPREITAKFDSKCAETGKPIKAGERCIYYPSSRQVFSIDSHQAYEYRQVKADWQQGYDY